jgi:tripartite-type tricarboxylate transporter receptor subunit TctC
MHATRLRILFGCSIFAAACFAPATPAAAQQYPTKPVRIVVPFAPGGGVDFIARLLGGKLTEALGQPIVVENRPGAGASVGIDHGMRATPDGYTLTQISPSYTINPSVRAVKFDPINDVTPIILVGKGPFVVVSRPSLPARNARELAALAKARPEQINYGTSGQGTIVHLATELFLLMTNTKMTHVPYKGGGPALVDVMSGQIQIVFAPPQTGLPHVKSGRLRAIGVTSAKRLTAEPRIPTFAESGVPGYEATNWHATIGPKGMPAAVVEKLNEELRKIVASEEIRKTLISNGVEPAGGTPDELMDLIRKDIAQWRDVVARAKVKVD